MKTLRHLFTAVLLLCSVAASAHDFEVDGIYYKITNSATKEVEVTYSGSSYDVVANEYTGNVVIPESVIYNDVTFSVTSIGYQAFCNCNGLTSVEIPNSVTSIGSSAFYNCTGLKSVEIGNSVTSIGYEAFRGCSGLTSIVIPNSVTSIGSYAFCNCSGLTSVEIGNSVTSIRENAFNSCTGLTSVEIPSSVTSIESNAFRNCSGLTSITVEDGNTKYDSRGNCNAIIETAINTLVTGCKNTIIPNSVTSIASYAFYNCTGLKSIEIPNSVTSIGSRAFDNCTGLKSIEIPNSITSIGNEAFYNCTGLKEVHISDLSAWCKIVFPDNDSAPLRFAGNLYVNGELLTNLVIPADIKEIKERTFQGCKSITNVTIPEGVTSIGACAFEWCSNLTGELVLPNSLKYIGGWAFNDCNFTGKLVIPDNVTAISNDAFKYNKFTSIELGNNITGIREYAFYNVYAVFDFAAETPATVASNAFHTNAVFTVPGAAVDAYKNHQDWSTYANQIVAREYAVSSVEIEASETGSALRAAIGDEFTTDVVDLTVKGSINSYDVIVLRTKMPMLRNLDLSEATVVASDMAFYNGNCTKDNDFGGYAFNGLSKLNYVKLPKDLVAVGNNMFENCSSLRELQVPDSVQSIGSCAFRNCSALKKIEMPKVMASIGTEAFYNCSSLEEITIPDGVKSLPGDWNYGIFGNCSALKKVTLPDGLESIGRRAFRYCSALEEIKLPPTVKTIDVEAFRSCSALEEIRIPSSVQSIGDNAFAECANLNKVYTYTVEPLSMPDGLFPTAATATLYAPSQSRENYYYAAGWNSFLKFAFFDEPYEYFYVNNDYVLNDNTGYIEGADGNAPDADINAGGGFVVEGEQGDDEEPNQNLGDVNVGSDGEGTSGSIIGDNNLHIDDLHIKITVKGGRWYFFAFPFDIKFKDISMQNGSDYVFRYYDGEERAQNGNGGWKDINENHLKAARGYIFQCSANDVLVLNIKDVKFKKEDKYNELVAHVSENLKDASWNFTGNPYLSYYDLADIGYTAPVTVWDGEKYVAIRPGDDDYHFAPYEAFFVQKPEELESIVFDGEEQMTQNQSENKKEKQAAARRARGINPERLLINIVLSNGTSDDRTRIVFNGNQSLAYETACDASKFETAGVAQLYTIGGNVHYAINERPADNGRVTLGYTAPAPGFYTVEAQRMDAVVYIKDFKTGTLHNLADGAYSFSTDAGTFNERFEIQLAGKAPGTTGIEDVDAENGEVKAEIYDLQGRKMKDAGKGIYIVNGEKVVK